MGPGVDNEGPWSGQRGAVKNYIFINVGPVQLYMVDPAKLYIVFQGALDNYFLFTRGS